MYYAKRSGRNTFRYFADEMNRNSKRKIQITGRLRNAIENDVLSLVYQPQIDLKTQKITGVEALLRWHDDELGNISPDEFIPISEGTGLIVDIGIWVLETACRQAKQWQDQGLPTINMAVNVSGRQLWYDGYAESVNEVLQKVGLDPTCLELELTETVIMKDPQIAMKTLSAIKSLGVKLALDDFGTGYSSLSYLKKLNVDKLKIDKSFMDNIPYDGDSVALVEATVLLAQSLSMAATEEGIETLGQLKFLEQYPCQSVQGFYFFRPLKPEVIESLLFELRSKKVFGVAKA